MSEQPQSTWRVIDFANEPKEYVRWINVPPSERLRQARRLRELVYVLQKRTRGEFQPVIEIIKR